MKGLLHGIPAKCLKMLSVTLVMVMVFGLVSPAAGASKKTVTVTTLKQLTAAMSDKKAARIVYNSPSKKSLTIKAQAGSENKEIVINAPEARITNKASFNKITIKDTISFTEKAKGNTIAVKDDDALIKIARNTSVNKIALYGKTSDVRMSAGSNADSIICKKKGASVSLLAADGVKAGITLSKTTVLKVDGDASAGISVNAAAKNSTVTTAVRLNITASAAVRITLNRGAEGTVIDAASADLIRLDNNSNEAPVIKIAGVTADTSSNTAGTGSNTADTVTVNASSAAAAEYAPVPTPPLAAPESASSGGSSSSGEAGYPDNTVTSAQELEILLERLSGDSSETTVTLKTSASGSIVIPAGSYPHISLVVDTPNSEVTNNAGFKGIEILGIGAGTWIEKGLNNTILLKSETSHIIVESPAEGTGIIAGNGVLTANIENNGSRKSIGYVTVTEDAVNAAVRLYGSNNTPYTVANNARGAVITTMREVNLSAAAPTTLQVLPGGENTLVTTVDRGYIDIYGAGNITVTETSENGTESFEVTGKQIIDASLADAGLSAGKGKISGILINSSGEAVASADVTVYHYKNSLSAALETEPVGQTKTGDNGYYSLEGFEKGNYYVCYRAEGYLELVSTVCLTMDSQSLGTAVMVISSDDTARISIYLHDSGSTSWIDADDVVIELREGFNNITGPVLMTASTDEDGDGEFSELAPGYYTVRITGDNYVSTFRNISIRPGDNDHMNISVSHKPDETETENTKDRIRYILEWASEDDFENVSYNLDAHLTGPGANDDYPLHIYDHEGNAEYYSDDELYASIDVYRFLFVWRPETVTVRIPCSGLYHYYVYDQYDRYIKNNTRLTSSQTFVEVQIGGRTVARYYVPSEGTGTLWDVCTYDTDKNLLTPVNEIHYHSGSNSTIGMPEEEILLEELFTITNVTADDNDII
ncbi:MAG: carboxypeptidase regulatory-like domain-containing protein, partial [Lachnospiraceae bacterium]|nr:carboxypeptidase regulatory-like domain-containing protein [Lachnospiraceae bacterium]